MSNQAPRGMSAGFTPVLLWENQNPKHSFAAQTIQIPELAKYDFFLVGYGEYSSNWKGFFAATPTFAIFNKGSHMLSSALNSFEHRNFTINDDSVVFEGGFEITSVGGQSLSGGDTFCIPRAIYGLR